MRNKNIGVVRKDRWVNTSAANDRREKVLNRLLDRCILSEVIYDALNGSGLVGVV